MSVQSGNEIFNTESGKLLHMPYLFHEPALSLSHARSAGVGPGVALTLAILGTTVTMVVLSAIVG